MENKLYYGAILSILRSINLSGAETNALRMVADIIDETEARIKAEHPQDPTA